jgi:hypothetical protein
MDSVRRSNGGHVRHDRRSFPSRVTLAYPTLRPYLAPCALCVVGPSWCDMQANRLR